MTVFDELLEGVIIDRHTTNESLMTAFLDKSDFQDVITHMIGTEFYRRMRSSS